MDRSEIAPLLARLLLPLFVILGLGVYPIPIRVSQALERANLAMKDGNLELAGNKIAEAAELLPGRDDLWIQSARLAFKAQDYPSTIERYQKADKIRALSPDDRLKLGDSLMETGDTDGAISAWEIVARESNDPGVYRKLAKAHDKMGDHQKAIDDMLNLVRQDQKNGRELFSLGKYLAVYRPEEALPYLTRALSLDTELTTPIHILQAGINQAFLKEDPAYRAVEIGRALAAINDWSSAEKSFEIATQRDPTYAEAWALLGEARQQLGASGTMEIQQVIELNSHSPLVEALIARYWERQGKLDLALRYLQMVIDQEPVNPVWQSQMGELQAQNGELEKAMGYYQRAAEITPLDPTYWRLLAGFSLRYSIQIHDVGLSAARRVLDLAPEAAGSFDLMGQVMVALGDYVSAERFYDQAFTKDPHYVIAQLHLGQLDLIKGDPESASVHFHLVLNLQPEGDTANLAKELLDRYVPK